MVLHAQEVRRPPALPGRQRRRGRAGHLQGPRHHAPRPAQAGRGLLDRQLRDRREHLLHLHPRRVRARGREPADRDRRGLRGRPDRQERLRVGLRFRPLPAPRRWRLYLRRGNRADRKPGRQEGPAAPQAAVSRRRRTLWLPDHGQQRRDDCRGADDSQARARLVRRHRPAQQHRYQDLLHLRPREQALQRRGGDGDPAEGVDRPARRRGARGLGQSLCLHSRRVVGAGGAQVGLRHAADGLRFLSRRQDRAGHGGRHRDGQVDRHRARDRQAVEVLHARELRAVHALPRRHRLDVAGDGAHGARRCRPGRDRPAAGGVLPGGRPCRN
jgi:hypothetical protein